MQPPATDGFLILQKKANDKQFSEACPHQKRQVGIGPKVQATFTLRILKERPRLLSWVGGGGGVGVRNGLTENLWMRG